MKNIHQIKKIVIALIFVLSINTAVAQEKPSREKIESLKIAFITEKLDLSEKESQQFWPIYNNYKNDLKSLKGSSHKKPDFENMSDKEINNYIDQKLNYEEQKILLKKEFFNKCKSVLSMQKLAKLFNLEKEFRREILNRVKNERR